MFILNPLLVLVSQSNAVKFDQSGESLKHSWPVGLLGCNRIAFERKLLDVAAEYSQVLYLVDVRYPIVSQVNVLEICLVLQTLYLPDEVVVQIQSLEGFAFLGESFDLLYLVEREDESVQID